MKSKSLSLFHLNINYLQKHFDDFEYFLNDLKLEFDFIGITESRLLKSQKRRKYNSIERRPGRNLRRHRSRHRLQRYVTHRHARPLQTSANCPEKPD